MYKAVDKIMKLIEKPWTEELTMTGKKSLAESKILTGIFQRDALSPLQNKDDATQSHTQEMHRWIKTS